MVSVPEIIFMVLCEHSYTLEKIYGFNLLENHSKNCITKSEQFITNLNYANNFVSKIT